MTTLSAYSEQEVAAAQPSPEPRSGHLHRRQCRHPPNRTWIELRSMLLIILASLMTRLAARGVAAAAAADIRMMSVDRAHVVNPGDTVAFDCQFHADRGYNLFDYPVLWRKSQLEYVGDDVNSTNHGLETGSGILQVNIMGNINEPFLSTNRFEALYSSVPAASNSQIRIYALRLNIADVAHEDSGNYTCEVRGPHSIVLRRVTHSLYVRNQVMMLVLSKGDSVPQPHFSSGGGSGNSDVDAHGDRFWSDRSSVHWSSPNPHSLSSSGRLGPPSLPASSSQGAASVLRLVEGRPSAVRCDALGGFPAPRIDLFVGMHDISSLFMSRSECRQADDENGLGSSNLDIVPSSPVADQPVDLLLPGHEPLLPGMAGSHGTRSTSSAAKSAVGMRRLTCTAERWSYGYLPTADDDQQTLSCVATVTGLKPVVQTVRLDVDYSPRINCPRVIEASLGDDDVSIDCDISAKPPASDVFWVLEENGTAIRPGDVITTEFVMTRTDMAYKTTRVLLRLRVRVERRHFRTFTLVAENRVAIATKDVRLIEKRYVTTVRPSIRHLQLYPPPLSEDASSSSSSVSSSGHVTGSGTSRDIGRRSSFYKSSTRSSAVSSRRNVADLWRLSFSCGVISLSCSLFFVFMATTACADVLLVYFRPAAISRYHDQRT